MQAVGQADTPAPGSVFLAPECILQPCGVSAGPMRRARIRTWGPEPSCTPSLFLLGGGCRGGRAGGGTLSLELSPGSQDRAGEWFTPHPQKDKMSGSLLEPTLACFLGPSYMSSSAPGSPLVVPHTQKVRPPHPLFITRHWPQLQAAGVTFGATGSSA